MVNGNHEIYKSSSLFIRINFIMQINAEKFFVFGNIIPSK